MDTIKEMITVILMEKIKRKSLIANMIMQIEMIVTMIEMIVTMIEMKDIIPNLMVDLIICDKSIIFFLICTQTI